MSRAVAIARTWLGTPYLHGTSVRGAGTDCLGLIRGVWREMLGREPQSIPTYTADWSEPAGDEVLMEAAMRLMMRTDGAPAPGQMLLFRMRDGSVAKHLGILSAVGDAPRFIHAYSGRGVVENSLSKPWARRVAGRFEFPTEG